MTNVEQIVTSAMREPRPWWWPDTRGWVALGTFALASVLLWMIHADKTLLDSAPFMQLAGTLLGTGGLGLILSFNYSASSGSAKANDRADKALNAASALANQPSASPPSS